MYDMKPQSAKQVMDAFRTPLDFKNVYMAHRQNICSKDKHESD